MVLGHMKSRRGPVKEAGENGISYSHSSLHVSNCCKTCHILLSCFWLRDRRLPCLLLGNQASLQRGIQANQNHHMVSLRAARTCDATLYQSHKNTAARIVVYVVRVQCSIQCLCRGLDSLEIRKIGHNTRRYEWVHQGCGMWI